jgi:hypothetical protein
MQNQKIWTIIERVVFILLVIANIYYLKCNSLNAVELQTKLSDQDIELLISAINNSKTNNEYTFLERNIDNRGYMAKVGTGNLDRKNKMMIVGSGTLVRVDFEPSDSDYHHNDYKIKVSKKKIDYWKHQYKYNETRGIFCFKDAERRCWYLPTITDYDMGKNCFIVGIAFVGANEPRAKIAATIISAATIMGLACIEEWNHINTQLKTCQYHFEMCDFYADLLKKYEAED